VQILADNGDNGDSGPPVPRRPSLEPKPTTDPDYPWLVDLPPSLGSKGKRERRYFETKKTAEEFARGQRIRLENFGTASTLLPAGKVEEAAAAFEKLNGTGATLTEAVEQFLRLREARAKSIPFAAMFARFRDAKAGRSDAYKRSLRQTAARFAELDKKLVCDITASDIEPLLTGMPASVRNAFLRNLRAAFNFAFRREWCVQNPILRLDMESLKMRRELLTNEQVSALLASTIQLEIELLPFHTLCLFAGIRPDEVKRLTWANVNFAERFIEVPAESAKTDIRRIVEMEPVLVRWLKYYKRGRVVEAASPVVPPKNLRKRLRAVRAAAGIEAWPQDAPRRTYASCWLAIHNDVNRLNNLMGHTSPDMLWRHYHRAVTKKRAAAFWKIGPPR
jgi:integrase